MDKNNEIRDMVYLSHNEKFGVMSVDDERVVTRVLDTDLTLVYDKRDKKTYLLVPLTKNHKFVPHICENGKDCIEIDGKMFNSDNFFRKDGCQWVEIDNDVFSKVA